MLFYLGFKKTIEVDFVVGFLLMFVVVVVVVVSIK